MINLNFLRSHNENADFLPLDYWHHLIKVDLKVHTDTTHLLTPAHSISIIIPAATTAI